MRIKTLVLAAVLWAPFALYAQAGPTPGVSQGVSDSHSLVEFLTADRGVSNLFAYPAASKADIGEMGGKRWLDFSLKGTAWSGAGLSVERVDLSPYRAHGALQFYVRGTQGAGNLSIGFVMASGPGADEKWALEDTLPINHYVLLSDEWTRITIPLADFPLNGSGYDDRAASHVTGPFQWGQVVKLVVEHTPTADPMVAIQLSLIRVVPFYDPKTIAKEKTALQQ